MFFFGKRSAITPPNREKSNAGNVVMAAINPTQKAELVRVRTSHPKATFCIQVPERETNCPINHNLKFLLSNAGKA
ncbi:hypothetical protein A3H84_03315 [Candidatus Roizmanbacteria bacterium RIFCSPLOWO2_02_FULL_40_13]|nr:MAG: hypothetical protein A3C31_01845 [Candidatus Roizmanbacteria bacterium RIFCSPHIGHO2_02_FULL_40_53]OGK59567.1 MAG: hypothetical protein A3H84_03315 [Candidatus Roizmanbacteria bacterium RIFCSPLOWO2_02_FULL_40_13]